MSSEEKHKKVIVSLPIEVPNSQYCWDGKVVCEHFDNEGGHGTCEMRLGPPVRTNEGYGKPPKCMALWCGMGRISGVPRTKSIIHYRPSNGGKSACGLDSPKEFAYDPRDCNCRNCMLSRVWCKAMGMKPRKTEDDPDEKS